MSIIDPTLTKGNGRYLNKSDFPDQTGLFGYHMNQDLGTVNPSSTSRDNIPTLLTDDPHTFIMEEMGAFGSNGRTMLVDDHVGNYVRSGAFVTGGRTSEFGLTTSGDNLLFSRGVTDFTGKIAVSFWMRMRNGATGNDAKGTVLNWNSGTAANGTQNGNIFLFRGGPGLSMQYSSAGALRLLTGPGLSQTISVPAVADWIHFAMVKTFSGNNGNGLYNIYVNGVKTRVTTSGFTGSGAWGNIDYNEAATALNDGSTFTFDLSEVWLTSETAAGYSGTVWDDGQVLKMYQIGAGLFREPDFTIQSKANNTANGTFTWLAPAGVININLTAAAGGGGGGRGGSPINGLRPSSGGAGGGGGAFIFEEPITIVPGTTYTFVSPTGVGASTGGGNFTLSGNINGTASSTFTINGGSGGGGGSTSGSNFGTAGASSAGAGGTSSTSASETTVAGAAGGAGPAASTGSSPGGASGGSTTQASGGSGGGGTNGAGGNHASGGGGGGASLANGSNGSGAAGGSAPGAGGGGGGGGFLVGTGGGGSGANSGGAGGNGGPSGFSFTYDLPNSSTDSPLVGP